LFVVGLLFVSRAVVSAQDGIYADFSTSMGNFSCKLEYGIAPKAVANFIGLATGQRAWIDSSGAASTSPFYNGLIFHRVIAGFVIQTGSPTGLGTDGPGYAFIDEFDSSLRFNSYGVLAMANSGQDSNGSQFFVTATNNVSSLNDKHTIFGRLVTGSNVVYAINHVATDENDKPQTNVIVQTVAIRRVGTAAQAFDINQQGLPTVTNLPVTIRPAISNQVALSFSRSPYSVHRVYSSTNFNNWDQEWSDTEYSAAKTNTIFLSTDAPQNFYSVAQASYFRSGIAPTNMLNHKLTLKITSGGSGTITITFDGSSGGKWSFAGSSGTLTSYTVIEGMLDGAYLWPVKFSNSTIYPLYIGLYFTSPTAGTFRGLAKNLALGTYFSIAGTFTFVST